MDEHTNLDQLKEELKQLRDERDWSQFHNPKDVGQQIAVEAGELLELFLWQNGDDVAAKMQTNKAFRQRVEDEFADILLACFTFANTADIDITSVVTKKLAEVRKKYPVDKAKGVATKYNEL